MRMVLDEAVVCEGLGVWGTCLHILALGVYKDA